MRKMRNFDFENGSTGLVTLKLPFASGHTEIALRLGKICQQIFPWGR
jgi:hypothetical protein